MKSRLFIGIGILSLCLINVLIYFSVNDKNQGIEKSEYSEGVSGLVDTNSLNINGSGISDSNEMLKDLKKQRGENMSNDFSNTGIDLSPVISSIHLDGMTESDLSEVELMLKKFELLDNMSDSDIIDTLLGFFTSDQKPPGLRDIFNDYYKSLGNIYGNDISRYQRLLIMVHFTQEQLSTHREIELEVLSKTEFREELLKNDPDLYYDMELQDTYSDIFKTEESILQAEAQGDTPSAEFYRNHLTALHNRIDSLNFERNFDEEVEKMKQDILKERFPDGNYSSWVEELIDEMSGEISDNSDDLPSSDNSVLNPDSKGLIKDLNPAVVSESNLTLDNVLSDVGEKYFDVVISRYFTPDEFKKYYPNAAEINRLKLRTATMQQELAFEIRKILNGMDGLVDDKKREITREFLNKNYDEDFASEVIDLLDRPTPKN